MSSVSNQTGIDDCKWIDDIFYSLSTFATGVCSSFKVTQDMCYQHKNGCKNIDNQPLLQIAHQQLSKFCILILLSSTCSLKNDCSGCMSVNLLVQDMDNYQPTTVLCIISNAVPPICQLVTQVYQYVHLTGLYYGKCSAYNSACNSLSDGSGCQSYQQNCVSNSCATIATSKLFFNSSFIAITSKANLSTINRLTKLDNAKCQVYFNCCTSTGDGSGCQALKNSCKVYMENVIYIQLEKCIQLNNYFSNPATDCAKITRSTATITYEVYHSTPQFEVLASDNQLNVQIIIKQLIVIFQLIVNAFKVIILMPKLVKITIFGIGKFGETNCNAFKSGYISNGSQCKTKVYSLASGLHSLICCNNLINTFTVNIANNVCITLMPKCSGESQNSCLKAIEGGCVYLQYCQCIKQVLFIKRFIFKYFLR